MVIASQGDQYAVNKLIVVSKMNYQRNPLIILDMEKSYRSAILIEFEENVV